MRKILIITFLLIGYLTNAQPPTPSGYTKINMRYDWLSGKFGTLTMPAGGTSPTEYGGAFLKGNLYWDSVGKKLRILDGTYYRNYPDSVYVPAGDSVLHVRYGTTDLTVGTFHSGTGGGGGSPAGNYGNVQINRNSLFSTPASDTLTYSTTGGLVVKNKIGAANGTILLPSIVFNSDNTDGFWHSDNYGGEIGISIGGILAMRTTHAASITGTDAAGEGNLFVGYEAGINNNNGSTTNGIHNTFVGPSSGTNNTDGAQNAFFGNRSGARNTTGLQNTFIGQGAGFENTTNRDNTYLGFHAGLDVDGSWNTFIGHRAGEATTPGQTANANTAVGDLAMQSVTSATQNVAVGRQSLDQMTSGGNNTALGYNSAFSLTTGSNNTVVGFQAGYTATPANALTTGGNNTFIGQEAGFGSTTQRTNATAIGYRALVNADNALILGAGVNVGIGTQAPAASSLLDMTSTTQGFLAPRMNTAQQNAISSPATGLLIFNTDTAAFRFYSGSAWVTVGTGSGGGGGGGSNRMSIIATVVATDANFTAAAGTAYHLPAATLSAGRTIDMTNLNTNGDYVEFYNNETGFIWSFTGATVYDSDGSTTVSELLVNTNSVVRRMNGKLMISKL